LPVTPYFFFFSVVKFNTRTQGWVSKLKNYPAEIFACCFAPENDQSKDFPPFHGST